MVQIDMLFFIVLFKKGVIVRNKTKQIRKVESFHHYIQIIRCKSIKCTCVHEKLRNIYPVIDYY